MTIDEVYKIILFIANKNSVGYLGPDAFNTLFKIAQDQVYNDYMDGIKGWKRVGPDGRAYPGDIQPNTDSLAPFKIGPLVVSVNASNGNVTKPADLIYLDAMTKDNFPTTGSVSRVTRVEEDRKYSFISSVIDPVATNPIYVEYADVYQVYPFSIGSVTISYYRMPVDAVWGYTLVGGRPVYNPGTSVQPEWTDDNIMKILIRMCFNLGIRLKDGELISYTRIVDAQGE